MALVKMCSTQDADPPLQTLKNSVACGVSPTLSSPKGSVPWKKGGRAPSKTLTPDVRGQARHTSMGTPTKPELKICVGKNLGRDS